MERECQRCGKGPDEVKFAYNRAKLCELCRVDQNLATQSKTPEAYLSRTLCHTTSKMRGKRVVEIDLPYLLRLWDEQKGRCAISGVIMTHTKTRGCSREFNASIDRINSREDYLKGNVQLVADRVNSIKNDMEPPKLEWWIKTIYENITSK